MSNIMNLHIALILCDLSYFTSIHSPSLIILHKLKSSCYFKCKHFSIYFLKDKNIRRTQAEPQYHYHCLIFLKTEVYKGLPWWLTVKNLPVV